MEDAEFKLKNKPIKIKVRIYFVVMQAEFNFKVTRSYKT